MSTLGKRWVYSEETKKKIREKRKLYICSEETKNKMRLSRKGKHHTQETKNKISKAHKGIKRKPFSEEWLKNISEAQKGRHHTEESKKKIADALKGKKFSQEHKRKLSEIAKNRIGKNNSNWKGGKVKTICTICKKEKHVKQYVVKQGYGKLCSLRCLAIWRIKHQKTHDTDIECLIENELIKRNIPHIKQAPLLGIALVDFLLPNKIIIQCDGEYWHSRKINKGKDIAQDTILYFKGYKVFRFTDKEIKKSAKKCIGKVITERMLSVRLKDSPKLKKQGLP